MKIAKELKMKWENEFIEKLSSNNILENLGNKRNIKGKAKKIYKEAFGM